MASLKQKVIPLQFRTAKNREDFIVGSSNNEAIIWIDKYPSWQNDAFIIVGAKSSGKSHLCSVWQKKSKCLILDYNDVNIENKNAINSKNLAIENIEYIKNLKYLLHIINIKKEKGFKLLMTSGIVTFFAIYMFIQPHFQENMFCFLNCTMNRMILFVKFWHQQGM